MSDANTDAQANSVDAARKCVHATGINCAELLRIWLEANGLLQKWKRKTAETPRTQDVWTLRCVLTVDFFMDVLESLRGNVHDARSGHGKADKESLL